MKQRVANSNRKRCQRVAAPTNTPGVGLVLLAAPRGTPPAPPSLYPEPVPVADDRSPTTIGRLGGALTQIPRVELGCAGAQIRKVELRRVATPCERKLLPVEHLDVEVTYAGMFRGRGCDRRKQPELG